MVIQDTVKRLRKRKTFLMFRRFEKRNFSKIYFIVTLYLSDTWQIVIKIYAVQSHIISPINLFLEEEQTLNKIKIRKRKNIVKTFQNRIWNLIGILHFPSKISLLFLKIFCLSHIRNSISFTYWQCVCHRTIYIYIFTVYSRDSLRKLRKIVKLRRQ